MSRTKYIHHHNTKSKQRKKLKTKTKPTPTWYLVAYGPVGFTYPPSIEYARSNGPGNSSIGPYNSHGEAYSATFGTIQANNGSGPAWSVTGITNVSSKTVRYQMVHWTGPTAEVRIDRASSPVFLWSILD